MSYAVPWFRRTVRKSCISVRHLSFPPHASCIGIPPRRRSYSLATDLRPIPIHKSYVMSGTLTSLGDRLLVRDRAADHALLQRQSSAVITLSSIALLALHWSGGKTYGRHLAPIQSF